MRYRGHAQPEAQHKEKSVDDHSAFSLYPTSVSPLPKDTTHFLVGLSEGFFRRQLTRGGTGKHGRNKPIAEYLINSGISIPRVTQVGCPLHNVRKDFILVGWSSLGIVGNQRFEIWHGLGEAREVIKLAGQKPVAEIANIIHQELLGPLDVLGKFPDHIDAHEVL